MPCDLLNLEVSDQIEQAEIFLPKEMRSELPSDLLKNISEKFTHAKQPILVLGSDVKRFGWTSEVWALIRKLNLPFATLFMGKSVLNEQDANFIGIYAGELSDSEATRKAVETSDCVIAIGIRRNDFTIGGFLENAMAYPHHLLITPVLVRLGKACYANLHIPSLLQKLLEILPVKNFWWQPQKLAQKNLPLTWNQQHFWPYAVQHVIHQGDIVAAEVGTSLFGLLWQRFPDEVSFISQTLWASIGFTLPAILGAAIAQPQKKGVLFIGDGSALLTIQEISSMVRFKANILIILINNQGYTVERAIHGAHQSYNDIPAWDYQAFARSIGISQSAKGQSFKEFTEALALIRSHQGPALLECVFTKQDIPELLAKVSEGVKKQNEYEASTR